MMCEARRGRGREDVRGGETEKGRRRGPSHASRGVHHSLVLEQLSGMLIWWMIWEAMGARAREEGRAGEVMSLHWCG